MNERVRHVRVPPDREGQRLDNLLMGELKGVPRSLVYRLIRKGQVRVNGGRAKPMQRLRAGDEVRIPPVRTSERAGPPSFTGDQLREARSRIIFDDRNYLAIDKPSGMAVHAGSGIAWGVIDLFRAMEAEGNTLELVHRLDRETSGCLLLARNRPALLAAQAALRDRQAEKRYLCLVIDDVPEEPFTVDAPLSRNVERGGERLVVVDAAGGRAAVSHFRTIDRYGAWTLMAVRIETGRTHQIRVHAAHVGYPIAGDPRYGVEERPPGLKRLFLHCAYLSLPLPDLGTTLELNAPLPDDLRSVIDRLEARKAQRRAK